MIRRLYQAIYFLFEWTYLPIIKYPQIFYCGGERIPSAATDEGHTQASFLFVVPSIGD